MDHRQTAHFDFYEFDPTDAVGNHLRFFCAMWNFGVGSAALARPHQEFLDELVERSQAADDGMIWLQLLGLASRSGKRKRNEVLSGNRVAAVGGYLFNRGLHPDRILSEDFLGEDFWAAGGVADGTEDFRHRAVYVWCWLDDPRRFDRTFPMRLLARAGVRVAGVPAVA